MEYIIPEGVPSDHRSALECLSRAFWPNPLPWGNSTLIWRVAHAYKESFGAEYEAFEGGGVDEPSIIVRIHDIGARRVTYEWSDLAHS